MVLFGTDELLRLKQMRPAGLELLGFKPRECLKAHHNLRAPYFIYPNERAIRVRAVNALACICPCAGPH